MTSTTTSAAATERSPMVRPSMSDSRTMSLHPDLLEVARVILDTDTAQPVEQISDALYQWYVNATPLDSAAPCQAPGGESLRITPAAAFRHVHAGSQRFEPGWTVTASLGWGAIAATSAAGVERIFRAGEFRRRSGNQLPAIGESILGEVAWSWIEDETGFWLTRRGVWEPIGSSALVRVYFNATPTQACALISELTAMLLADGCSFMLKTPAAPQHNGRADALVLYLGDADWSRLQMAITTHTQHIMTRAETPRFAARVAPGIAWSVGPLSGESFGKLRSDLIAQTVHRRTFPSQAECVAVLAAAFEATGLSTAQPHLQPVS